MGKTRETYKWLNHHDPNEKKFLYAGILFDPVNDFDADDAVPNQVTYTPRGDNKPFSIVHPPPPGVNESIPLSKGQGDFFRILANGDLVLQVNRSSSRANKK